MHKAQGKEEWLKITTEAKVKLKKEKINSIVLV
jgi:hypothetical protein